MFLSLMTFWGEFLNITYFKGGFFNIYLDNNILQHLFGSNVFY
jgi:hypothetical protein